MHGVRHAACTSTSARSMFLLRRKDRPSHAAASVTVRNYPIRKGGRLMRPTRWQPFNPVWNQLNHLQSEMNQLFDRWGDDGRRLLGLPGGFPAINVWEDAEAVHVEAELPGLD